MALTQIKIGSKVLPVFHDTVDGEDVYYIISQSSDDGGAVCTTFVLETDGVLKEFRSWRGIGSQATDAEKAAALSDAIVFYQNITDTETGLRKSLAKLHSQKRTAAVEEEIKATTAQLMSFERNR